jgi:RNA recognition motif-containing protein
MIYSRYPLDIQNAELIEIFSIHGMMHSITLLTDKNTGKHEGYGFIEMIDKAGADRAIVALDGMMLRGRKITVKLAIKKERKSLKFTSKAVRHRQMNGTAITCLKVKVSATERQFIIT